MHIFNSFSLRHIDRYLKKGVSKIIFHVIKQCDKACDKAIFSFIWYTLTALFRKPNNLRQIYKQATSTFYTSNDVSKTH